MSKWIRHRRRALTLPSYTPPILPTDGGTPLASSKTIIPVVSQADDGLYMMPASREMSIEARVRRYLNRHPDASIKTLARALHISESTASKYRRVIAAEQASKKNDVVTMARAQ